jgi:hypothetical protein
MAILLLHVDGGTANANAKSNARRIIERIALHHTENTLFSGKRRCSFERLYAHFVSRLRRHFGCGSANAIHVRFQNWMHRDALLESPTQELNNRCLRGLCSRNSSTFNIPSYKRPWPHDCSTRNEAEPWLLSRCGSFRCDAKRGNLATAAGYISQAGGAKTREISGEFSAE